VLVKHMEMSGPVVENSIRRQQLRDESFQFLSQKIRRISLGNKARNVVAFGNPDASPTVPLRPNLINARGRRLFHYEYVITAAVRVICEIVQEAR